MVNVERLVKRVVSRLIKGLEEDFDVEKSNEAAIARDRIIQVFKENKTSLPAAVFVCDVVKWELLRAGYLEFMGNVKIPKGNVPLSTKNPTPPSAAKK